MIRSVIICCLLGGMLLFTTACPRKGKCDHKTIIVLNKSTKPVYGLYSYSDTGVFGYDPKTLGKIQNLDSEIYRIEAGKSNDQIFNRVGCLSEYFDHGDTNVKMYLYIYDPITLQNIPWDTIKANDLYLKKYSLHYQRLNITDWIVTHE